MHRRRFLTGAGVATTIAIAGCSDPDTTPDPTIESVEESGMALQASIDEAEYADRVEFDVENEGTTSKEVSPEDPIASYKLGDPETIGTENQQLFDNTRIEIKVIKENGTQTDLERWTFSPEFELTDIHHSEEFDYTPQEHDTDATPVFEFSNTGGGPGRIEEFVIFDIDQDVPLEGTTNETAFAHSVIAQDGSDDRVHPVETHDEYDFVIPGGESSYFAIDGLLTHTGERPEDIDSVTQRFDVEIRWLFGELRFSVSIELNGGIVESDGVERYRFKNFEMKDIDYASPLR